MNSSPTVVLSQPEPAVTVEEMVSRARSLRPTLRDQQSATEDRGTYSEEMHQTFQDAGFYRMMQPRRFGGYEFGAPEYFRVIIEVARGCPGTGWCLCLAAGHNGVLGSFFSEQAQAVAYGDDGNFAAPFRPFPMGTAKRAPGGWQINGEWNYCSGAPYSTHAILGVRFEDDDVPHDLGLVLIGRDQWTMLDDWRTSVLGMSGSGSNTVRVTDAVVDDESVVFGRFPDELPRGADAPGYRLHGNPLYAGITEGYGPMEVTTVLVGCARAAADEYERILREKKTSGPNPQPRFTAPEYVKWYCEAVAKVDAAEGLLLRGAQDFMSCCEAAVSDPDSDWSTELAEVDLVQHEVTNELAWSALELMFRTSGSSEGARRGSRMQRYYRDYSMGRTNVAVQTTLSERAFAAAYFGA